MLQALNSHTPSIASADEADILFSYHIYVRERAVRDFFYEIVQTNEAYRPTGYHLSIPNPASTEESLPELNISERY